MPSAEDLLKKLEEREAKLKEKIKHAKAAAAKEAADLHDERCRLIGDAVLAEMEENAELKSLIQPILNTRTISPKARKMLGLGPLSSPAPKPDLSPKGKAEAVG